MDTQQERTYTLKELQDLQQVIFKHDTSPANALGTNVAHGLEAAGHPFAGTWSTPGPQRDMYHTVIQQSAFASTFVRGVSRIQRSEYEVFTGVQAGSGTNPVNICDAAPRAGLIKSAIQRAFFGVIRLDTDTNELPTLGGYLNEADYDRNLINSLVMNNPLIPDVLRNATNINTQEFEQFLTMALQLSRVTEQVTFQGNNTVANGASSFLGIMREWDGFDQLIGTGKVDARTNQAAPALDSLVVNWGSALITGNVVGPNGVSYNIVEALTEMWHFLNTLSDDLNMSPTTWVISMHPDMFRALTRVWACTYLTNACLVSNNDGERLNVDAAAQKRMMDEMFTGNYLWMDGQQVPYLPSRGMANTQVANGFRGDIYFIPISSLGTRTTYLEFFDQSNPVITGFNQLAGDTGGYRALNGGQFAVANSRTRFCLQYHLVAQPRLVMRTPWLAARMTNVVYRNLIYTRDPIPGNVYHADGGVTQRFSQTLF